jgi:hypothetical protein
VQGAATRTDPEQAAERAAQETRASTTTAGDMPAMERTRTMMVD